MRQPDTHRTNDPPAASSGAAGPIDDGWPRPVGAVEILPANASTTMYERWQAARHDGIGGSDIATVLGLVSYESEFGLWLTKTGRRPPVTETPIMTRGRYAELMLGQWFADKTGLGLRKTGTWARLMRDPATGQTVPGWMRCNPDRFTSDGGGAEFKAPDTDDWADLWRYGPALHAQAQGHWCMAVTGLPHWYTVADGGKYGLKWWRIDYNPAVEAWMIDRAGAWFHRHIVEDEEPAIDGSDATAAACKEASSPPGELGGRVEMPGAVALATERLRLKAEITDREKRLKLIENMFRASLLTAETACEDGVPVLSWKWEALDSDKVKPRRVFKEPKDPAAAGCGRKPTRKAS